MKSIVFLYAGFSTSFAFDSVFSSRSAFERSLVWASGIKDALGIFVAVTPFTESQVKAQLNELELKADIIKKESWNMKELIQEMARAAGQSGAGEVIYSFADRPFLDSALTVQLLQEHEKYSAEYTFADGYPEGFAPEIIHSGTLAILSSLISGNASSEGAKKVTPQGIFAVMKTDINSFEIETVLSQKDYRMLRLDFSCSSLAGKTACTRLYELSLDNKVPFAAESLSEFAEKTPSIQRTVPAFYNIQLCRNYTVSSVYNPYFVLPHLRDKISLSAKPVSVMSLEQFKALVSQIASFSGSAVIGLSACCDPVVIPNLSEYVKAVLEYPSLSVLIESDGIYMSESLASFIAAVSAQSSPRTNGMDAVTWIISVDAFRSGMYSKIHGEYCSGSDKVEPTGDGSFCFEKARQAVSLLSGLFPGAVYPQFLRMNVNENELEPFYRYYHDKASPSGGKLIIQKYDHYCRTMPDEKSADLSPLLRNPCWHIKRDMMIMNDGSVPFCRECLEKIIVGNVFRDGIKAVWEKMTPMAEKEMSGIHEQICEDCDEYYTFNF
ncbi:MAG: spiro-SPASM protein [Treponema sp.]|nr:spiro-SPASM protein [Treponema sp.]